jgi:Flp pilus assembly protein TadG
MNPNLYNRIPRRQRGESGSAIVEGALIFLPLMALFFAMIDFPFAIFIQNSIRNAVREGVRFAISQQTGSGGQDAAIDSVVEGASFGFISSGTIAAGTATLTIQYYDGTTLSAVSGTGSNAQGNICVVSASVSTKWMAPVWRGFGVQTFSASSADVMEAPPSGILPTR